MSTAPKSYQETVVGTDDATGVAAEPVSVNVLPLFMSVEQLAELLGVSDDTVYKAVNSGELPGARRIGRVIRIHRDRVLEYFCQDRDSRSSKRRAR